MKLFTTIALAAALCLPAAPLFAAEGVLIVQKVTAGPKITTSQMQIEKDRMRSETEDTNGAKQAMVFDGPKQVMTTINFATKTYNEMTKAQVDQLGAQATDAMAQMQERMARMTPAQRAQMDALMRGRGIGPGAAQAPKIEYRKAGSDRVGKWTCDKYEAFQNNEKVAELCTVDPKVLGFSTADFEITKQMAEFFKKMVPAGAAQDRLFAVGTPEAGGFSGMPVRRISYSKGQIASTTEITEVSRQNFPASSYAVPAGFTKQEMFGGRGRGRGVTP